jgi:lipid A 3-O-deacylase
MRILAIAAAAAGLTLSHTVAAADEGGGKFGIYELKGGVLAHDTEPQQGDRAEDGVDLNLEAIFTPSLPFLGGSIRPALGASANTAGDTSQVYLDARWEYEFETGAYVGLGLGAAVHNGETGDPGPDERALGSPVLFHIPVEAGYRFDGHHGVSLYFDHISNANLADHNEGLNTLGVRYGYRF